ncbi:hypothetical protein [Streptomyces sp. cg35]|uniref:hypothetical protein n=1 Tax=Streptomyces sp. cg35 TaxID=3421650 RepID=UPI003D16BE21
MFLDTFSRPRFLAISAAVGCLAFTLSGCSGEEPKREYSTPSSLCGTKIEANLLEEFLPAGEKLTVRGRRVGPDTTHCDVRVDSKTILVTTQTWWESGSTVARFAMGQTLDDPDKSSGAGSYLYSGYQAFGKVTDCVNPDHEDQELYTGLQATGSKHRDADSMLQMIKSYTKDVRGSQQCQ